MIIVAGTIEIDPDQRAAAIDAVRDLIEGTRAEEGCLDYSWAIDPVVDSRIWLFERWASTEALAAHFQGKSFAESMATVASFGFRGAEVLKYRADVSEPVFDDSGKPRADFFTA